MTDDRFTGMAVTVSVSVVVAMLVAAAAASTVGVGAQQAPVGDDWVDTCDEAETITESGTYNGTIDTPDDVDVLGIEFPEKGAYVTVQLLVPTSEDRFAGDLQGSFSIANTRLEEGVTASSSMVRSSNSEGIGNSSFAVFAEQSGRVCLGFSERDPDQARFPYQWQATLTFNAPSETDPPGQILSPEEATQYRQDVRTLAERVNELEATVEDLERRVTELEAELQNQTDGGDDSEP